MIGRLRGTLADRTAAEIVVDVGGVGYRVAVPPGIRLPEVGEEIVVHAHLYVREDAMVLYGFATRQERDLFELLLGCQGIGPKVALACLSVLSPDALTRAVLADDVATLTLVPGIGKRSAEKLVFELKPRLGAPAGPAAARSDLAEVREALGGLGYGDKEVSRVLADLPSTGEVGDLLREALRILGGNSA
jgi:Holliday junction DNA helicase RuvA